MQEFNFKIVNESIMEHEDTSGFICEVCAKQLKTKNALKCHKKTHVQSVDLACSDCPKTFSQALYLKKHKENVHGNSSFKCETCEKLFSTKSNLKTHETSAHQKLLKNCTICNEQFHKTNLKRHETKCREKFLSKLKPQQTGNNNKTKKSYKPKEKTSSHKMVQCTRCNKILKSSLERHMETQHKVLASNGESFIMIDKKIKTKPKKMYKCDPCNQLFSNKSNLE